MVFWNSSVPIFKYKANELAKHQTGFCRKKSKA
jgi:hypothetical protein